MTFASSGGRGTPRVVIAGGGFAGLEALMAVRELAGERVGLTLVSPETGFRYRPAATVEVFTDAPRPMYDLRLIAAKCGASYHQARLESVGPTSRYVRLSSGSRLPYDLLVLAVGARARSSVAGALTFRDQRDAPLFRRLLGGIRSGDVRRLVYAQPAGCSWSVPLLELALLSRTFAAEHGQPVRITVVSPEPRPLMIFGSEASTLVEELLESRDVRFVGGSAGERVRRDGALELASGASIDADRVVAVPQLRGPALTGVPASGWGFVPTDRNGLVESLEGVYAAGDMTTFPIKHGGLATQQADRIARRIAETVGAPVPEPDRGYVLRTRLLGGERPLVLCAEINEAGNPIAATLASTGDEDLGDAKVFARYLSQLELGDSVQQSRRSTPTWSGARSDE